MTQRTNSDLIDEVKIDGFLFSVAQEEGPFLLHFWFGTCEKSIGYPLEEAIRPTGSPTVRGDMFNVSFFWYLELL